MRSWIFVPGSQEKHLKRAKELPADVLIFDLEDAVSENDKENARLKVKDYLGQLEEKVNFVRVNALSTPYFIDDIRTLAGRGLSGIVLPKVSHREDIKIADYLLRQYEIKNDLPGEISIMPIIESALGLYNAYDIAAASKRISCLSFGAEDFKLDVTADVEENETELLYARSKLVTDSRAAGIQAPIDSVYTDITDENGLKTSAYKGKKLGFQGKLLIHPKQINAIHQVYSPSAEQIQDAKKMIEVYESNFRQEDGAIQIDGKMVDRPIVEQAKKLLADANVSL